MNEPKQSRYVQPPRQMPHKAITAERINWNGDGVRNILGDNRFIQAARRGTDVVLSLNPNFARLFAQQSERFLGRITAKTAISGASNRYEYTVAEVVLSGTTFATKTDGRTVNALNLAEAFNTGDGIEGNQVDVDDADVTVTWQAADYGGRVVWVEAVPRSDGTTGYVFELSNGITGECP